MTCPYITSLERPCGREAPHGFCPLHAVLAQLDEMFLPELQYVTSSANPEFDRVRLRLIERLETSK